MLFTRVGLTLPRPLLRRVADTTLGNPLFVLEMGRALAAGGQPRAGEEVPLPDAVDEALGARVAALGEQGPDSTLVA